MKKLLATAILLTCGTAAMAMGPGESGKRHNPEKKVERMTKNLNLDAGQQQELRRIMDNAMAERKRLREQMKAQREATEVQIHGMLNAEQRQEFAKMKAKRKERTKERWEKRREMRKQHGEHRAGAQ